jgi:hypothetical protein
MMIQSMTGDNMAFVDGASNPAMAATLRVGKWTDHAAILDALYRFGAGQDSKNRDLFASAFMRHAQLDFVQPAERLGVALPVMKGREQIVEAIMTTLGPLATTHTITNQRVAVDGNTAAIWALVEAQHVQRAAPEKQLLLKNIYHVRVIRDGDLWRIEDLKIENVWHDSLRFSSTHFDQNLIHLYHGHSVCVIGDVRLERSGVRHKGIKKGFDTSELEVAHRDKSGS